MTTRTIELFTDESGSVFWVNQRPGTKVLSVYVVGGHKLKRVTIGVDPMWHENAWSTSHHSIGVGVAVAIQTDPGVHVELRIDE